MLLPSDQHRACFAPNDSVEFKYRNRMRAGTIVRANPKRAVVRVGEQEYAVPYELLVPTPEVAEEREQRIESVLTTARDLLWRHGLKDWRFKFDHSTRRAGCCNYHDKQISISFDLARHAKREDIRDTLLHEIAHALVGKKHNHDAIWGEKAKEIGGSGERCHRLQFSLPRYHVTCENLCWTHTAERRNPRLVCRTCGGKLVYSAYL